VPTRDTSTDGNFDIRLPSSASSSSSSENRDAARDDTFKSINSGRSFRPLTDDDDDDDASVLVLSGRILLPEDMGAWGGRRKRGRRGRQRCHSQTRGRDFKSSGETRGQDASQAPTLRVGDQGIRVGSLIVRALRNSVDGHKDVEIGGNCRSGNTSSFMGATKQDETSVAQRVALRSVLVSAREANMFHLRMLGQLEIDVLHRVYRLQPQLSRHPKLIDTSIAACLPVDLDDPVTVLSSLWLSHQVAGALSHQHDANEAEKMLRIAPAV